MKTHHVSQFICSIASVCAVAVLTAGCAAQGTALNASYLSPTTPTINGPQDNPALLDPSKANEEAPDQFKVKFETTKGDFVIEVNKKWAPNGANRFYNMVKIGYFKDIAIFRAIKSFMFQFGIHGDPKVSEKWGDATIKDDPSAGISNLPGYISFAQTGLPNSRSAQMFVNLGDNSFLDKARGGGAPFVPFGKVVEGMDVVEKINTEYGENARDVQGKFKMKGNAYIKEKYPNLDYIKSVTIVK